MGAYSSTSHMKISPLVTHKKGINFDAAITYHYVKDEYQYIGTFMNVVMKITKQKKQILALQVLDQENMVWQELLCSM